MSQNNQKVLFIVGPTSTGKTSLALKLAAKLNGDLISADSRQVYKHLDVLTGKDIPEGFVWKDDRYTNGVISIYGLDILDPKEQWSAGAFQSYAQKAIKNIQQNGRLSIVVGGTGFYVQSLLTGVLPPSAPANDLFRKRLEGEELEYLQNQLKQTDPERFKSMNHSDLGNKRRLIRALEIDFYKKLYGQTKKTREVILPDYNSLVVGLNAPIEYINNKIETRVKKRIESGVQKELEILESISDRQNIQSYSTLGYRELERYQNKEIDKDTLIKLWTIKERRYAKRQITWFKKQKDIYWYDITMPGYLDQVEEQVTGWYSQKQ